MTPHQILDNFLNEEKRKQIFVRRRAFSWISIARLIGKMGYKYITPKKLDGLRSQLNGYNPGVADKTLPETAAFVNQFSGHTSAPITHLLIVGFDYHTHRARYFRSNVASLASSNPGQAGATTLAQAIHASSNAPLNYFDAPAEVTDSETQKTRLFWDGAITGQNNPVGAAVIEALANGNKPGSIVALSIGTGSVVLPHPHLVNPTEKFNKELFINIEPYNFKNDILKIASSIVEDPPEMASFKAFIAAGGTMKSSDIGPVIRMSPLVQPVRSENGAFDYPTYYNPDSKVAGSKLPGRNRILFNKLKEIDMDAVEDEEVALIKLLCRSWLLSNPTSPYECNVYNQPVQTKADLTVNIGHRYYVQAKAAALSLGLSINKSQPLWAGSITPS